ncbi:hypothetical protein MBAV_003459 [Candidatus Magnetobacterium bavaricum]|uniref:Uncharacterized protein n=1 Tax=Candidatus Magnetobacterium bavaricum TaxID=29290 RepID=A0A0F3GRF7_9BACT|nr:hypothetical protein MBAV_003459 [Candidatus Magnetobacterium bavaricum]
MSFELEVLQKAVSYFFRFHLLLRFGSLLVISISLLPTNTSSVLIAPPHFL